MTTPEKSKASSDSIQTYTTHGEAETERLGACLAKQLRRGSVAALTGELGAGKTALVRGMVSVLAPECAVSSPTYALVNQYGGVTSVFHFDLYRLSDDLESIGFDDYLSGEGIVLIEWAERAEAYLPADAIRIHLEHAGGQDRRVIVRSGGAAC